MPCPISSRASSLDQGSGGEDGEGETFTHLGTMTVHQGQADQDRPALNVDDDWMCASCVPQGSFMRPRADESQLPDDPSA